MSKVSVTKTGNDLYADVIKAIDSIADKLITRGDCVLIKPNLVVPADPESGVITTPKLIEAVGRYCLDCGAARVIIGEGSSYFIPQSSLIECFTQPGIIEVADRLGIEWVLFDEHKFKTFPGVPGYTPTEFRITEFAFTCDKFINLPILKTHFNAKVTLAMKNLKGCLKREDKPLFHRWDLSHAVVELCKIVRPTINIIDCTASTIVCQLGKDYSDWRQAGEGLLIASSDIVATDAVGCALMGIDPAEVDMVTFGNAAGLGEDDITQIDIMGEEIKRLEFKIKLPQEELRLAFPLLEIIGAEKACSGCLIPLLSVLMLLQERGANLEKPLAICLGEGLETPEDRACLLVGNCAQIEGGDDIDWIEGCPPSKEELLSGLTSRIISPL